MFLAPIAGTTSRPLSFDTFFGFKVHSVINDCGERLSFRLTPGKVDDRRGVPELVEELSGKLFGDQGYISQPIFETLYDTGVQLVTKLGNVYGHFFCY